MEETEQQENKELQENLSTLQKTIQVLTFQNQVLGKKNETLHSQILEFQIKESSLKSVLESQNLQNNESGNDLMTSLKSKAFQLTGFSPKIQDHPFFTEKSRSLIYSENLEESQKAGFEPMESVSKNILRESIKSKLMKEKE